MEGRLLGYAAEQTLGSCLTVECHLMRYLVHIEQDEDGVFVSTCPGAAGKYFTGRQTFKGRSEHGARSGLRKSRRFYRLELRNPQMRTADPLPASSADCSSRQASR
jgi:hypothetical protein